MPKATSPVRPWFATPRVLCAALIAAVAAALVVALAKPRVHDRPLLEARAALLQQAATGREQAAARLTQRLAPLRSALADAAARVTPELLADPAATRRMLLEQTQVIGLFGTLFALGPDGRMVARLQDGKPSAELADLSQREHYLRLRETGQPVVSRLIVGTVSGKGDVVFAAPVKSAEGRVIGALGAGLHVQSNELLLSIGRDTSRDESLDMIIDASGRIVAHDMPSRLLGQAADEPGLAGAVAQWQAQGRLLRPDGRAMLADGQLVSSAGLPEMGWTVLRATPEALALRPLLPARRGGLNALVALGLLAALLAGALAWRFGAPMTQPDVPAT